MIKPSTSKRYFTMDIGQPKSTFLNGPLVLTYVEPEANVRVVNGHCADAEQDAPTVIDLRGNTFGGEFFVRLGQCIVGETQRAIVSGYFPFPELPPTAGPHRLPCGAELFYNFARQSNLLIKAGGIGPDQLKLLQRVAVSEAEEFLNCRFNTAPNWEVLGDDKAMQFCFCDEDLDT